MLTFQHIEYLYFLLLLLVPVSLLIYAFFWRRKIQAKLGNPLLIGQFIKSFSARLFFIKPFLILIALAHLIIAAANPRKLTRTETKRTGIDLMFVLDVSNSMLSVDIKPSRLLAAKQFIKNLIQTLNVNRIGLIVFAGKPLLQLPVTDDMIAAEMYLDQVGTDAVPEQGTSVGDALALCDESLNLKEYKYKAVVFISDGEAHDNTADMMAQQLHDHGVVVYTIGVGTSQGSIFKEPGSTQYKTDEAGKPVISRLNEPLLKNVASITGGNYFLLNDQNNIIPGVKKEFSNFEKKHADTSLTNDYFSYYQLFLVVAIFFLVLEIFISEKK